MTMPESEARYCLRCGTPLVPRMKGGRLRPVCPACGWAFFPDPKVAVAVLIEQDDRVLLVRRVHPPEQGRWTLPAGFVDAGEDPVQAAIRECREETGLSVAITGLLDVLAVKAHPEGADILLVYRGRVLGGTLTAGDDADRAAFFPRHRLPPLAFASTRRILGLDDG